MNEGEMKRTPKEDSLTWKKDIPVCVHRFHRFSASFPRGGTYLRTSLQISW